MAETGDRLVFQGFTTVHLRRWIGPEWGRGIVIGGRHRLVDLMRTLAILRLGEERCYGPWEMHYAKPNKLMTAANKGRDVFHSASFKTAAQPKGAGFMAAGKNAGSSCTAASSTLPNEFTAPSNMARKAATLTHTNATNTSTLIATFTNNGAGATDVKRMALFNSSAAGSGNVCICNSFTVATLQVNDAVKITETVTMG